MAFTVTETDVVFDGACSIEEAEDLHQALKGREAPRFDLARAGPLHTAILQIIMASGGTVSAMPSEPDPLLAACLAAKRKG